MEMVNRWLDSIQAVLFPALCLLCGERSDDHLDLCPPCRHGLPWLASACRVCATPLPESGLCGRCLRSPPAFDSSIAAFHYAAPVDFLVQGLKFHGRLVNARVLGSLMARHIMASSCRLPEVIIPVPLHHARLCQRGFNQSVELARWVSRLLQLPLDVTSCRRVRDTQAQSHLPMKQRRHNIAKAFRVSEDFAARHVAIIDDVMTTTYTAHELAKVLRKAGAVDIDVWCCARVSLPA